MGHAGALLLVVRHLLLLVRHLFLVAMHLFLIASCSYLGRNPLRSEAFTTRPRDALETCAFLPIFPPHSMPSDENVLVIVQLDTEQGLSLLKFLSHVMRTTPHPRHTREQHSCHAVRHVSQERALRHCRPHRTTPHRPSPKCVTTPHRRGECAQRPRCTWWWRCSRSSRQGCRARQACLMTTAPSPVHPPGFLGKWVS